MSVFEAPKSYKEDMAKYLYSLDGQKVHMSCLRNTMMERLEEAKMTFFYSVLIKNQSHKAAETRHWNLPTRGKPPFFPWGEARLPLTSLSSQLFVSWPSTTMRQGTSGVGWGL